MLTVNKERIVHPRYEELRKSGLEPRLSIMVWLTLVPLFILGLLYLTLSYPLKIFWWIEISAYLVILSYIAFYLYKKEN